MDLNDSGLAIGAFLKWAVAAIITSAAIAWFARTRRKQPDRAASGVVIEYPGT